MPLFPNERAAELSRRNFFTSSGSGLGGIALTSMLAEERVLRAELDVDAANPLLPKEPHFAPKAKSCIFVFLAGAPSHVDLYDPKPVLAERNGQKLPKSLTEQVRFAFIKKESAILMGSKRKFTKHGDCGMELCDLLPNVGTCADDIALVRSMHTDAFNHHPAQLMMTTGVPRFGRPSLGSWLLYGLGSVSKNLPGYVVLNAGRGSSGGVSNWTSGFFPSTYEGVVFRSQGEPVLNLNNPPGFTRGMQQASLNAIGKLNRERYEQQQDPEIASRISSYELAFRMQAAAPELLDFADEPQKTLDSYGVNRAEPAKNNFRGGRTKRLQAVLYQLPARAAFGRERRALRHVDARFMGSSQQLGRRDHLQRRDAGSTGCGLGQGPQATRHARRNARDLCR